MKKLIQKYKRLEPQTKAGQFALISVVYNSVLAVGKGVLAIFRGIFFLVSGLINLFFGFAKLECYFGLKNYGNQSFKYRNIKVATFLLVAGLQYTLYMASLIAGRREVMQYTDFLSINIALIAFVELSIAIFGMFQIKGKGHYYRDIKLINLCSAMTALMWAEVALLSFTTGAENMLYCGISGVVVGVAIMLVAVYIYFAPRVSLIDRARNVYYSKTEDTKALPVDGEGNCEVVLFKSKVFGDYVYKARLNAGVLDGKIERGKNCWHKLDVWWKIMIVLFSEILIFAYAFWAICYFFRNLNLIQKLDQKMQEFGFIKEKLTKN